MRSSGLTGGCPALPLQATGMSGVETGIAQSSSRPGDVVIVGYAGFFGGPHRADGGAPTAHRCVEVARPWGEAVPNEALLRGATSVTPRRAYVAVVRAETWTGVQHHRSSGADEMRDSETLLVVDCVTSLGAVPVLATVDLDFAYSCTQKALGASRDVSIAFSERALERVRSRHPQRAVLFCR